jgi:hypothetical protein
MKTIRHLAARLLVLVLIAAPVNAVWAASIAYNSVKLLWSDLTVTGVDTGSGIPTLTWTSGTEYSQATASNPSDYDSDASPDWITPLVATVADDVGYAETYVDDQELFAFTYVEGQGAQYALGIREGYFTVSGNGNIRFEIPVEWDAEVVNDPPSEFVNLLAGLYALLEVYSLTDVSSDFVSVGLNAVDFLAGSGSLVVELPFLDGEQGLLYAEIYSTSAIPLPGTIPLLAAALLAWQLAAASCRRSAGSASL